MSELSNLKKTDKIRVMLAQINFIVADLRENKKKILEIAEIARINKIHLLVFPEMALTGYPIQDLLFDHDFIESEKEILMEISKSYPDITMIIGGFDIESDPSHHPQYRNVAYILSNGEISSDSPSKRLIPTYDVFDEKRYFWEGDNFIPYEIKGLKLGIAICEDLWENEYQVNVTEKLIENGAELIISINGSPYTIGKQKEREDLIKEKANKYQIPIAYLNLIGGQDELVFDGRSFIIDKNGELKHRAAFCKESLIFFNISSKSREIFAADLNRIPQHLKDNLEKNPISPLLNVNEEIIQALSMNLRDYYYKTGVFKRIVIGLSGGIDSAFTTYIAVKAVGKNNVTAILMPSRFSSKGSLDDSIELCKNLGIEYIIVPIKESHSLFEIQLEQAFERESSDQDHDLANQNLQSRLRGLILMYYSNKFNALLVSTGNKSEIATGYCTLYGDTNGGKNVPGDLYKTQLYQVINWINRDKNNEIIPYNIITKPPSAELKENQIDEDNLPPYKILDEILALRIDEGLSPREIIKTGKNSELVNYIEHLYTRSEFKRSQLVQTIKINKKAFGMGRKIPILKHPTY
ncbi:NAD+ synthase [Promethearchaeum syntrophicum]|uniref:Glutamine-dependent NAD(+) synthetase n=1 Tax=Promethearchaeum syntrophicum TaxID=2594042 RepID=A0A5B9DDK2_9ARCH|nr:NAD+ synthase [Candidatus Prometheoarchaeum syntrophicum]QEE17075.1 putative NH(3)-dependent NAD(+) synthetase [Candidatus Prometheoarchaeum syntrophicum]